MPHKPRMLLSLEDEMRQATLRAEEAEKMTHMLERAALADGAIAEARAAQTPGIELAIRVRASQLDALNAGLMGAALGVTGKTTPESERSNAKRFMVLALTTGYVLGHRDALASDLDERLGVTRTALEGKIRALAERLTGARMNYGPREEVKAELRHLQEELRLLNENAEIVRRESEEKEPSPPVRDEDTVRG